MNDYFTFRIYTKYNISKSVTLKELWEFLDNPLISPKRFDSVERVKREFSLDSSDEALEIYRNTGMLFVKGKNDGFLALFEEYIQDISLWSFQIKSSAIKGDKGLSWIDWIVGLCEKFPILYGSGSVLSEYNAKHQVVENTPRGGQVIYSVGASAQEFLQYLPGIYWITIFGPELTSGFGLEKLRNIPYVRFYELASGQSMVCIDEPALPINMNDRLKLEQDIAIHLNPEYFFDRSNSSFPYRHMESFAARLSYLNKSNTQKKDITLKDAKKFLGFHELADNLVIYTHKDIPSIFQYNRQSLSDIDVYLTSHPQYLEYHTKHIEEEFLPALGGYIGETLIRCFGGRWNGDIVDIDTSVHILGDNIYVFRDAVDIINGVLHCTDVYDRIRT